MTDCVNKLVQTYTQSLSQAGWELPGYHGLLGERLGDGHSLSLSLSVSLCLSLGVINAYYGLTSANELNMNAKSERGVGICVYVLPVKTLERDNEPLR